MILIIGGNGSVVNTLIENFPNKQNIIVAGRSKPSNLVDNKNSFYKCDFLNNENVENIKNEIEKQHHIKHVIFCISGSYDLFNIANTSVKSLKNALKSYSKYHFIYISTIKANPKSFTNNNNSQDLPLSNYGWIKLYCEELVKNNAENFSILRLAFLVNKHSNKYYKPKVYLNFLVFKVAFGLNVQVKAINGAGLGKQINGIFHKGISGETKELWNYKERIIEISKEMYPDFIWIKIPKFIAKNYLKHLYNRSGDRKFIDYYPFFN